MKSKKQNNRFEVMLNAVFAWIFTAISIACFIAFLTGTLHQLGAAILTGFIAGTLFNEARLAKTND